MPFMDKPILFLGCDKNSKFFVNEEATRFLENVTTPISVVAVAGRYRTGKSYLLNRIFNTNKGFSLGSTVESKTKGIWMWAKPHPRDPDMLLILLDTEGLHDVKKGDHMHDIKLFSLAILLSKCLVYNAIGSIDDKAIRELELVASLTKHVRISDETSEENGVHFGKYFPHLFVVLRDFFLDIEVDGKRMTSDEYLEDSLALKVGRGRAITDYNTTRECIRDFFPRRNCFTLCKPVDDDEKLRTIDEIEERELKKEFVSSSSKCVESILRKATLFELDGNQINGQRYIELAKMYVEAINDDSKVPCVQSTIQYMKIAECKKAAQKAMLTFDEVMRQNVPQWPVEFNALDEAQAKASKSATETFERHALMDTAGKFREALLIALEDRYTAYKTRNAQSSTERCQSLLKTVFEKVTRNINSGTYQTKHGYAKYSQDKEDALSAYRATADKGPEADKELNNYLERQRDVENTIINADLALDHQDKEKMTLEKDNKLHEERNKALKVEQERMLEDLLRQATDHTQMMEKVQKDFQEEQRKHEQDMKEERELKQLEYDRMVKEGVERQAETQKMLLEQMAAERELSEKKSSENMKMMEETIKSMKDLVQDMQSQHEVSINKIEKLRGKMDKQYKSNIFIEILKGAVALIPLFVP